MLPVETAREVALEYQRVFVRQLLHRPLHLEHVSKNFLRLGVLLLFHECSCVIVCGRQGVLVLGPKHAALDGPHPAKDVARLREPRLAAQAVAHVFRGSQALHVVLWAGVHAVKPGLGQLHAQAAGERLLARLARKHPCVIALALALETRFHCAEEAVEMPESSSRAAGAARLHRGRAVFEA